MTAPSTKDRIQSLVEPAVILSTAVKAYICVLLESITSGQISTLLTHPQNLRDDGFSRFWLGFSSTPTRSNPAQLEGSAALIPPLLARVSGTVLDVGPGTGTQMPYLSARREYVKGIYGAEPCKGLHGELRAKASKEGLDGKYHVLGCGVSAGELVSELRREGLLRDTDGDVSVEQSMQLVKEKGGIFDTIICVRVLCSVPDLEQRARELYTLLKPGGQLLVAEHVVNPWQTPKGSFIARLAQGMYELLGWQWFMGDCCMVRDTEGALRRAAEEDGGWGVVDVERSFGWSALPYISGVWVKQ